VIGVRRETLIPFLPAVLAAVTNAVTVCVVTANQPDYPARAVVYQVVMFGAALLSAVPKKWVRIVGFVILLAGVFISMAIGLLYVPTFLAAVWVMTRDERPSVQSTQDGPAQ
jgi:cell division protein FtsW (lipid II flippase)